MLQVVEELMRTAVLLHFLFINKEGLIVDVKVKGSLDYGNRETAEFRIPKAGKRVKSRTATLYFSRKDFDHSEDLLGRIPWDKAMQLRECQESRLIFKAHLL